MEKMFLNVNDVKEACCCSRQKAYMIIREANEELKKQGFLTQQGKIPRKYFFKMIFGETGDNKADVEKQHETD